MPQRGGGRTINESFETESAGANGAAKRFYDAKADNAKKTADALENRVKQYKRAGYGDKSPSQNYDMIRSTEKHYRNIAQDLNTKNDGDNTSRYNEYLTKKTKQLMNDKDHSVDADDDFREFDHATKHSREVSAEKAKKNERINNRSAMHPAK